MMLVKVNVANLSTTVKIGEEMRRSQPLILANARRVIEPLLLPQTPVIIATTLVSAYVTISQLAAEGKVIGTITVGGIPFNVSISQGPIPTL